MSEATYQPYSGPEKLIIGVDLQYHSPIFNQASYPPSKSSLHGLPRLLSPRSPLSKGEPVAVEAECLTPLMKLRTSKEQLYPAKWWKLHLHPRQMQFNLTATLSSSLANLNLSSSLPSSTLPSTVPDFEVPSLPPKVTIDKIYRTFLGYIFQHARAWWIEHNMGM
ncbi:hypothetical protein BCR35DRAFT_333303 [Leucosporidium creatinivorum]|uniref:Uncharacterized protein n=1 Tax=Leucosporidium creatinivorum TaxID=106004 RepID=A0A1Y2ET76_9BASI|nr:hypothetical protein BCR35DRAFT_333303 [Leucosporidium creatinivorum]